MVKSAVRAAARRLPDAWQRALKRLAASRRDAEVIRALAELNIRTRWETPACDCCGGRDTSLHVVKNGFKVVRCERDGLLFVSPRPSDVAPYYDSRYYTGGVPGVYRSYDVHAADMQEEWTRRLGQLGGPGSTSSRLLDVGAATGEFLVLAREKGWDVMGVELSAWAADQARTTHGLEVICGSLQHVTNVPPASFDVVTMWDCIEHLSEPRATLDAVRDALKPGGMLALSTGAVPHLDPQARSGWYFPPWHLYYFSRETIHILLDRSGFDVIEYIEADRDTPYAIMTVLARLRGDRAN